MRARFVNEKFEDESDPIHDMNIGPQDYVYRCIDCGNYIDKNGDNLEGGDLEYAEQLFKAFGNKKIKPAQCFSCYQQEQDQQAQEYYAREQEHEYERQRQEEERWQQDRFSDEQEYGRRW
jgi:hypothetical protein